MLQLSWGIRIPQNGKKKIPIIDEYYTILNNVCLGNIESEKQNLVIFNVRSINIDQIKDGEAPEDINVLQEVLIPHQCESIQLQLFFSSLNTVEIENKGPNEISISGKYELIEDDDDEEEFEEEEDNENDELRDINQQIVESLQKSKP